MNANKKSKFQIEKDNPSELFKYINKFVSLKLKGTNSNQTESNVFGWLYTIDPVSFSVVLVNFEGSSPKSVCIYMEDHVDEINLATDSNGSDLSSVVETEFNRLFSSAESDQNLNLKAKETEKDLTQEQVEKRRKDLVDWFIKNRLPVKLDDLNETNPVISILDTVYIKAPYQINNCQSTNEIILDKIRQLVKNLPQTNLK